MNDIAVVPLRGRDGQVRAFAIVDAANADIAFKWRWSLHKDGYAYRGISQGGRGHRKQITVRLHREVLGLPRSGGPFTDHINRDRLDDRRVNLRQVTQAQNNQNVPGRGGYSQHRGVSWRKDAGKWAAYVSVNGRMHSLGHFTDEGDAAEAARLGRLRLMPYAVDLSGLPDASGRL